MILATATDIILNDEQQKALDELNEFYYSDGDIRTHALIGYAGCGKTTVITEWLARAIEITEHTLVTAPTNKATQVLSSKLYEVFNSRYGKTRRLPTVTTIHKVLGYQEIKHKDGTRSIGVDLTKDFRLGKDTKLIIIDEASMLGEEIYGVIEVLIAENTHQGVVRW